MFLGFVPALAWFFYFYRKSGYRSHSFWNLARVFFCGCLSTVPAAIFEHLTGASLDSGRGHAAADSFLLIGPTEEFFKLLAVWVAIYRHMDFREPIDGIVYSTTAALGFASVENIVYMRHLGPEVLGLRLAFATPAHVMVSSMWGFAMGMARFQRERELLTIFLGFVLAAAFHGAYNYLVVLHKLASVIFLIPLMVFMGLLMTFGIRHFRKSPPFASLGEGAVIACPFCGAYTLEEAQSCARCGSPIPLLEFDTPRYCGACRATLDQNRDKCPKCGIPLIKPG